MSVRNWKVGAVGVYFDPTNWVEGVAPGPGDTVNITGGIVRLSYRGQKRPSGMRDHTAATAFRHSLAASARNIRSVDRETRWR
jgi:hypothetical protein